MVLDELVSNYSGKYVEVAGSANAKFQCVDLANLYIRDVLGLKIIEWTDAINFPVAVDPKDFLYYKNTPAGVPVKGDLVIFGGNQYGHISIFIEGDAKEFRSFDQNFPTGSPCQVVRHSYANVIGWLHPLKPMDESDIKKILDHFKVKTVDELFSVIDQQLKYLAEERNKVSELDGKNLSLSTEVNILNGSLRLAEDALNSITELASWQMGYESETSDLVGYINTLEEELDFITQKIQVPNNSDIQVVKRSIWDKLGTLLDLINNRLRRY